MISKTGTTISQQDQRPAVSKAASQQYELVYGSQASGPRNSEIILIATSSINSTPPVEILVHNKPFVHSTPKNDVADRKGMTGQRSPEEPQADAAAASPSLDKNEKSKSLADGTITRTDRGEPEQTNEDDIIGKIEDDEAEIGPIDDEEEEMGTSPECHDCQGAEKIYGNGEEDVQRQSQANADLEYEKNLMALDGGYYDGDEPEEDDSQAEMDDQEDFEC